MHRGLARERLQRMRATVSRARARTRPDSDAANARTGHSALSVSRRTNAPRCTATPVATVPAPAPRARPASAATATKTASPKSARSITACDPRMLLLPGSMRRRAPRRSGTRVRLLLGSMRRRAPRRSGTRARLLLTEPRAWRRRFVSSEAPHTPRPGGWTPRSVSVHVAQGMRQLVGVLLSSLSVVAASTLTGCAPPGPPPKEGRPTCSRRSRQTRLRLTPCQKVRPACRSGWWVSSIQTGLPGPKTPPAKT